MKRTSLSKRRLLFISHNASRTGAPILLYDLIKWIKDHHPEIQLEILLEHSGALLRSFEGLAPTRLWHRDAITPTGNLTAFLNRILAGMRKLFLWLLLYRRHYDLVYINSVAGCRLFNLISGPRRPALLHAHELASAIKDYCGEDHLLGTLPALSRIIAVSDAVAFNLSRSYDTAPGIIEVVRPWLPTFHAKEKGEVLPDIPNDAFIVGGSGSTTPIKGVDIFLEAAIKVVRANLNGGSPRVYFVWLGSCFDDEFSVQCFKKLERTGLGNYIRFIGPVNNPMDYYRRFDLFFLSSREDSFPLVVIENASVGTPVLCFDQGNGSVEVMDSEQAFIVPYLDVEAAAAAIRKATMEPDIMRQKGVHIKARFSELTVDKQAPKIVEIIWSVLASDLSTA